MTRPALLFRKVTVRYADGSEPVLSDLSFSIAQRERVALVGLNGSGKTTLLRASVGLVPHEGEIEVSGTILGRRTVSEIRERVGFLFNVPEDQLLFPKVIEDVAFGLIRRGVPATEAKARAQRALEALEAERLADSSVHHLSHGEKLRVAIAGAIVTDPALLLLDEPSAGLDPPGRRALARLLSGLDAAMLIATHDTDFAARVCPRWIVLEGGRIAFDGPAEEAARRWEG